MPRVQTSGHQRFWPVKIHQGKSKDGEICYTEGYRDMTSGELHEPMDKEGNLLGWNGNPPNIPGAATVTVNSSAYVRGYEQIKWTSK